MANSAPKIPEALLDVANTTYASRSVLKFIADGKTETDPGVVFLCDLVDYDGTIEASELKFPGPDGVLRTIRRDQSESGESLTLKCYDLEKVITLLGGLNGFATGKAEIWIRDPKTADGKIRFYVKPFPCSVQRDGQVKFGEKTYSSANLKFTSTSDKALEFLPDATLTP